MTVFRIISGLAILALVVGIAFDLRRLLKSWTEVGALLREYAGKPAQLLRQRTKTADGKTLARLRQTLYGITAGFFLLLAVTGFSPILIFGNHLSGILLVIHVTAAPLFAISLSALALLWAHRLRFDGRDWNVARGLRKEPSPEPQQIVQLAVKAAFWLVLFFSLPLMLTVILGLFPLFGTEGEEFLIRAHGYSALFLTLVVLAQIHLTLAYPQHFTVHSLKE